MVKNLIIIGSGPSGYTAAIYAAREALEPLLLSGQTFGGQLMYTTEVENFPGFSRGIKGPQLMMEMRQQAKHFGTEIIDTKVTVVDFSTHPFKVATEETEFLARSVLISTGAEALTLQLDRERELLGRGVSVCAVCDAAFFKDKTVYVVGGGDSAMEDSIALTKYARSVYIVVRRDGLKASKVMQQKAMNNPKITILFNTEVIGILGSTKVEGLVLKNNTNGTEMQVQSQGLFYAIGHVPNSGLFVKQIEIDEKGYILTSLNGLKIKGTLYHVWREGFPTMTSKEGVFAAGDVVDFRYRQAITAAGMGTMAALDVSRWLAR